MVTMIFAIISLSLVVVTGYAGQISLAQLTLAGVAGFLLSPLHRRAGASRSRSRRSWPRSGATVVGVVVGLPALRIRGLLVAVVTLALAVALEAVWFRNTDFNGGSDGTHDREPRRCSASTSASGAARPSRGPSSASCAWPRSSLVAIGVAKLRTSRLGSAMLAVRANERSAAAAGINVVRVKLVGFAIGAFIAGLGGSLLAYKQTNVTFDVVQRARSASGVFATAYLAGITSVSGGVLAGVLAAGGLVFLVPRALRRRRRLVRRSSSGVGLILTVIRNPDGIVGPVHAARRATASTRRRLTQRPDRGRPGGAVAVQPRPSSRCRRAAVRPSLSVARACGVAYGGVVAVDDVSLRRVAAARSSGSSARTAPARRR